jgi:predicted ribosomally synthesized peptide with SipW-like signal peptide
MLVAYALFFCCPERKILQIIHFLLDNHFPKGYIVNKSSFRNGITYPSERASKNFLLKGETVTMKKRMTKILALVLAIATVAALAVGTFAFFTDRVQAKAEAKAGTLELALSQVTLSKSTGLKPGTGCKVDFTLSNLGNKSADVKEVLVLRSPVAMTAGAEEFDLYLASDVTLAADGKVTVKDGKSPVPARAVATDGKSITYTIPEFILNGTGDGKEEESGAVGIAKTSSYVLVFQPTAGNDFQGISVTLDYLAQAKQHRNTNAATWADVAKESISFAGGNVNAVPEK